MPARIRKLANSPDATGFFVDHGIASFAVIRSQELRHIADDAIHPPSARRMRVCRSPNTRGLFGHIHATPLCPAKKKSLLWRVSVDLALRRSPAVLANAFKRA
jgi:hypothetical protein